MIVPHLYFPNAFLKSRKVNSMPIAASQIRLVAAGFSSKLKVEAAVRLLVVKCRKRRVIGPLLLVWKDLVLLKLLTAPRGELEGAIANLSKQSWLSALN